MNRAGIGGGVFRQLRSPRDASGRSARDSLSADPGTTRGAPAARRRAQPDSPLCRDATPSASLHCADAEWHASTASPVALPLHTSTRPARPLSPQEVRRSLDLVRSWPPVPNTGNRGITWRWPSSANHWAPIHQLPVEPTADPASPGPFHPALAARRRRIRASHCAPNTDTPVRVHRVGNKEL